jgi:CRISPR-associated endonuclease Cas1
MAAKQTLTQHAQNGNSPTPVTARHGVVTLNGYGIRVCVERGHLLVEDGIGRERRKGRLPRVRHGLHRLVVIGSDGMVSLAAIRWLADQDASLVMLERNGTVLATAGPVLPSDARLRRAQSLAHHTGKAVDIARALIGRKLSGQQQLVDEKLNASSVSEQIARQREALTSALSIPSIREIEARAAKAYWSAWRLLPVNFPEREVSRVPQHWRLFGTRKSPLTGSPRHAVNPPNTMLNYLYALLESESRLALAALGLDPGIGVLHVDAPSRDSLACDLMEAVRPQVDKYVFDWIAREPLRRSWFFEERDGNCRLMGQFAERLSETTATWAHAVAPIAEWIARSLWISLRRAPKEAPPPTRLTQNFRRLARDSTSDAPKISAPLPPRLCRTCGEPLKWGRNHCASCVGDVWRAKLIETAKLGRIATHTPKAEALRGATQRRQAAARKAWNPSDKPEWLVE